MISYMALRLSNTMAMYFALGEDIATLFKPALFSSQSTEEQSLFTLFFLDKQIHADDEATPQKQHLS